jgi:hypothetical protein
MAVDAMDWQIKAAGEHNQVYSRHESMVNPSEDGDHTRPATVNRMGDCFSALFMSSEWRYTFGEEVRLDRAKAHAWMRAFESDRLAISSPVSDLAKQAATWAACSAEGTAIPRITSREHPPF